jgi:hypothetical protein
MRWPSTCVRCARNHDILPIVQCRQRYQKSLKPGIKKGKWEEEEDELLRTIINESSEAAIAWEEVSQRFPGRTSKQCRERWNNHIKPEINKAPFTVEDDERLKESFQRHGPCWSKIARDMNDRSENMVRRRIKRLVDIGGNILRLYASPMVMLFE